MTEVNVVLRVVDKVTSETVRIVRRFGDEIKRAASAVKSAFAFADNVGNVFEKIGKSVAKVYGFLKEAAPDAREFALALTDIEKTNLTRTVESVNRLKASLEGMFLKVVADLGPTISLYLDSLTTWVLTNKDAIKDFVVGLVSFIGDMIAAIGRMFFAIAGLVADMKGISLENLIPDPPHIAAQVQALSALKLELKDLQEIASSALGEQFKAEFSFQDTRTMERERVARNARIEGIKSQIRATEELIKVNRDAYYKDPTAGLPKLEANFESLGLVAKATEEVKDNSDEVARVISDLAKSFSQVENAIDVATWNEIVEIWNQYAEADRKSAEDAEKNAAKRKKLNGEVADTLRDLRDVFRELAAWENEYWDDFWADFERFEQEKLALHYETIAKQTESYLAYRDSVDAAELERLEKMQTEVEKMNAELDAIAGVITDRFIDAFESVIRGTENVGRAFTRMVGSIIADVGRMMATEALKKFISGLLGGLFSGEEVAALSSQEAALAGIDGYASGGYVPGNAPIRVGERGPEIFVPSSAGNILTASRSSASSPSIGNVSITVNGAQDPARTAREVKSALLSLLSSDPSTRQRLRVVTSSGGVG